MATPLVPPNSRWQSRTKTSSRSVWACLSASTARSAAVAAAGPWPRPSITPNRAAAPPMSIAIGWSPETYSPGSGRPAVAHSIGPRRPWSCTSRNPFPHFDDRSAAAGGFHNQSIHQAAGAGQAQAQPAAGRVSVFQCALDVGDTRAVILGAYHQGLAALAVLHCDPHGAATRVAGDVSCDFGDRGGDHGDVGYRKSEVECELVAGFASFDDVVGVIDVDDDVTRHHRARSSICDSAGQGPLRDPARCSCRRTPAPVGPWQKPPLAANPRSQCLRRATGSYARWSAAIGRRRNPSHRWR